jgi:putative heme-binding domain-containing protein
MAEIAKANGVPYVDLFSASQKLYSSATTPLTINGIHLTNEGNKLLAPHAFKGAFGIEPASQSASLDELRAAVVEKCNAWHDRYRTVDSYNIYNDRSRIPYASGKTGQKFTNADIMKEEMAQRDVMTENRDKVIWSVAQGKSAKPDDSNLPPVRKIQTNKAGSNPDGSHPFLSGEEAIAQMTVPKGCKVQLFASEEMFPQLIKPVQMAWDTKGRLWVAAWPNYPERTPDSKDGDKLLVLEDTNGDGKADKCTTFVDNLNCPTGFQFYKDGVLVMRSPNLLFLRDTNGDGKADWEERMLMGLDAADSHHETNSMCIDPGGAIYLSDGVFHRTQVETAAGPVRNVDGAIYRYEPLAHKFERYVAYGFANPHGRSWDYWGNDIITDGTGNNNYFGPAFSGMIDGPGTKHGKLEEFWKRPSRPCANTTFMTSKHFPEEYWNSFLNCNVITYQGVFRVKVSEKGSGLHGETQEHFLMSKDPNFRPVSAGVGPDGAVYVLDWSNAIIGHLQHHLRDPNRDKIHGRIYRVTYEGRPLNKIIPVDGQPVAALLDLLKEEEDGVRTRAKMELAKHEASEVIPALKKWITALDTKDANYEHHRLEGLWMHQWLNVVDVDLLKTVLKSPDHRARAAAARVLCYWRDRVPDSLALFKTLAGDEHPRVRLEAIRAASFYRGKDLPAAYEVAFTLLKSPMDDYYLNYTYNETLKQLKGLSKEPIYPADAQLAELAKNFKPTLTVAAEDKKYGPTRKLAADEKKLYDLGHQVFFRDAHCATCHQADGKGLAPTYPMLTDKEWLNNDERIIKIVLKGLWGPLEAGGKAFDDPAKVPPMTAFEALLKDEEIAGVLTYIRQSYGNDLDPVKPETVKKVRAAVANKADFYQVAELMKEHPVAGWENWKKSATEPRKFVKKWEVKDLEGDMGGIAAARSAKGKELFTAAGCITCHVMKGQGGKIGPDLTEISKKFKGKDLLVQILEPSKVIDPAFQQHTFKLKDGRVISGTIKETGDSIEVNNNPMIPNSIVKISKGEVTIRKPSTLSPMPEGLVSTLTKDEIVDLLSYLEAGGN